MVVQNKDITSKGHRALGRVGISEKDAGILIKNFKNLISVYDLKKEDLIPFFEEEKINDMLEKIKNIGE